MALEEAEAKIEALEEKLEALGESVSTLIGIVNDNLQHRRLHELNTDFSNYETLHIP